MAQKKKESRFIRSGRGIARDDKKKNVFFRFFELFIRKISRLCILNILYLICILPLICALVFAAVALFGIPAETVESTIFVNIIMRICLKVPPVLSYILVAVSAIIYGPVTCGFAYAMRNLITERHVWYSDMFTRAKENFKQGVLIGILDILIFTSFGLYISMDISVVSGAMHYMYSLMRIVAVLATVFYIFMRYYLYTLTVTFYLPIKAIFKNAYIFAVLGFVRNIITTVINLVAVYLFTATPYLDIFLMATLTFSFCGFLANYTTYPVIKKYMLDAQEKPVPELDEAAV